VVEINDRLTPLKSALLDFEKLSWAVTTKSDLVRIFILVANYSFNSSVILLANYYNIYFTIPQFAHVEEGSLPTQLAGLG
jgi:hypothetical protein